MNLMEKNNKNLEHFRDLAIRGQRATPSSEERAAYALAKAVVEHAVAPLAQRDEYDLNLTVAGLVHLPALGDYAIDGFLAFMAYAKLHPDSARDFVRA